MRAQISRRRFKKSLRSNESYLGSILNEYDFDITDADFLGRLDFWISYYVTALLSKTDTSEEIWSDGSLWKEDHHVLTFKALSRTSYQLSCELDLQDANKMYEGSLDLSLEFDSIFSKFTTFQAKLRFQELEYQFSEKY